MKIPFLNLEISFKKSEPPKSSKRQPEFGRDISAISPGRVSVPHDQGTLISYLQGTASWVQPSYKQEVIPLIRNLYKINPDVSMAIQDMFKLTNTSHDITFPNNSDKEADRMRDHLHLAQQRWSHYTAGINGLVNKMLVQAMVGGAISIEAVPNNSLDGVSTVLFVNPDDIIFERENDGQYQPYQKNTHWAAPDKPRYIKLNKDTYIYVGMYNDTDEPYGIPPFMAALDSLKTQEDIKINFKHIMEMVGMVGFLEAKMQKPDQKGNESDSAYKARLERQLVELKKNLISGMKDGVVTGYIDDHEFNLNSTTKELGNIDKPWQINQQSVANGLGINGNLIGISSTTESGAGVNLSKMISQLKNLQNLVSYVLEFIYTLELRLAGFDCKGIRIVWGTTTIADDVKIQQARQYKIQNLDLLYKAGIISQYQYAWEMGYDSPDQEEPRLSLEDQNGVGDPQEMTKKKQRQGDKNQSARRSRAKSNPSPSRGDQNSKPV